MVHFLLCIQDSNHELKSDEYIHVCLNTVLFKQDPRAWVKFPSVYTGLPEYGSIHKLYMSPHCELKSDLHMYTCPVIGFYSYIVYDRPL